MEPIQICIAANLTVVHLSTQIWRNSNMHQASCPSRVSDPYRHCPQHYNILETIGLILSLWGSFNVLFRIDGTYPGKHCCKSDHCPQPTCLSTQMWRNSNMFPTSCPSHVSDPCMRCPQHYKAFATIERIVSVLSYS